jgi:hypothetical protein
MAKTADDSKHWLEPPEWWKKVKPLRWAAILGILFVVASALYTAKVVIGPKVHPEKGRFTELASDPVAFLNGMKSYDNVESARARLDAAKLQYTVTPVHPKPTGKYPPRDRDTIVIAAYKHLGIEGELTLEFFNNRLYEATFVPADPDEYVEKLHRADTRLKRDRNGRAERIIGNLRVASNVDFAVTEVGRNLQTKPYVIWQDLRLVQLLDEWDRRFVAIPTRE